MQLITGLSAEEMDEALELLACCPGAPETMIVATSSAVVNNRLLRFSILIGSPRFLIGEWRRKWADGHFRLS